MATPREGFIELHDATVRAISIRAGGACEFALEGVSRYRHIAGDLWEAGENAPSPWELAPGGS